MNGNTSMADLWDQVAPDAFAAMVQIFANAGAGVRITPVPDESIAWEENKRG